MNSKLTKAIFAAGAFSARGQARLRLRDGVAYAAVIQMPCERELGRAMVAGLGGYWAKATLMWRVSAEDQLEVCNILLNFVQGHVADGVRAVALFRIGQPLVKPGRKLSAEVLELRRLLAEGLTGEPGCASMPPALAPPESSETP